VNTNATSPRQGLAITSLVLGVLSLTCLGFLAGTPAIILGHVAWKRARRQAGAYGGAGLALAGLIMGYLSIVLSAVVIAVVVGAVLPAVKNAQRRSQPVPVRRGFPQAGCTTQMTQIGLAFRIWAMDHQGQFPFHISTNQGGTLEWCAPDADGFDQNTARHMQKMAKELVNTRVLVCPGDPRKKPASSFEALSPENVSYQLRTGTNVSEANPQEILARCPIHQTELKCDTTVGRRR
jgi:hypothetical protein